MIMVLTFNTIIPLLTLSFYLAINWNAVKYKYFILAPLIAGTFLWFAGQLVHMSWLVWLGFAMFMLAVITDSSIRFKKSLKKQYDKKNFPLS